MRLRPWMRLRRWGAPACLALALATVRAGEAPPAAPGEDELAVWTMLNQHRADRPAWENMVVACIRAKQVEGSARAWNQVVRLRVRPQPLTWSQPLAEAAQRLLAEGAQPTPRSFFDAGPALDAVGYAPSAPALAMFGHLRFGPRAGYAACLLNVTGFTQSANGSLEHYAAQEAVQERWREVGVAIAGRGEGRRLAIIAAVGPARRCLGGTVFADADRDLRHGPGEGRPGVVVRVGAASAVTGPTGAWSLRLDHADAAEVVFAAGATSARRAVEAGTRNALLSWRLPDARDQAAVDRLLAAAEAPGLAPERRRQRLAELLLGGAMAALDDERARRTAELTAPLRDEFEALRTRIMGALGEDQAALRAACAAGRAAWGQALGPWFAEAERLGRLRAAVLAALAAPAAERPRLARAARAEVAKARAATVDPVFLAQYDLWLAQFDDPEQAPAPAPEPARR